MKFVDEAIIKVLAGNGGRGAVSFRREKFIPFGGPDGGDGGLGGSVYAVATAGINTLADFRVQRTFRAVHGTSGGGNDRSGAGGDDFEVQMPVGTVLVDSDTEEQLGDLVNVGERILVAKGGKGGWGNARFKSSTNRTPRKAQPGLAGEQRTLKLELKLIADVGLLGFPNAGKSTLISAVSAARPKVADYPFTTLHPNLGVVSVGAHRSFVMADIPGLIEGAAEGAGLGLRFLKHLQRTGLLLHLVDILPPDPDADPVKDARAIIGELKKFSPDLEAKERWLVLNKLDLLPPDEAEQRCKEIVRQLRWRGPVYKISGLAHSGTAELCQAVMRRLEEVQAARALAEKNEAAQENVEAEKIAATISAMIGSITIGSIKSGKTARPEKSQERTDQKKVPVKKVAIKKVARKKAPTKKSQAQKPGAKKSSSKKSAAKKAKRVVAIAKSTRAAPRRVQKQNLSVSNKKR